MLAQGQAPKQWAFIKGKFCTSTIDIALFKNKRILESIQINIFLFSFCE